MENHLCLSLSKCVNDKVKYKHRRLRGKSKMVPTNSFLSTQQRAFWLLPVFIPFSSLHDTMGEYLEKNIYTNMNYSNSTTMYESIFAQVYIFLVEKYLCIFCLKLFFMVKNMQIIPEIITFGPKYFRTL